MAKYLDEKGLQYLWSKISLEDYPNNETLIAVLNAIDQTKANKEEIPSKISQLENDSKFITETDVEGLYKKLNSNTSLGFYCVEEVTVVVNDVPTVYPANSNVEIKLANDDVFEIIPTSDNSIYALTAFPGALGTFYPWLEGIMQFSNILFDMNDVDMYSKWSQGNQGSYHVQFAQYANCIFWSDNPYVSEVSKRTNYTLYYTSQLPLCYSTIPENTFKSFYLAFNVNTDPNWGNKAYRDSFAAATWATQVFSYYGARTIGVFGHDDPDFNIVLPKDCRGLMYQSTAIENAGTFDAINTTNFGAKSGSWRDAFGQCSSLKNLYIKNLKVNLNISWSPINYKSIAFIIAKAANENAITISVSPYTYNLLSDADFELATSKNITIALITTNYTEDKRLGAISTKADKSYVDERVAALVNSAPETLDTLGELATALNNNEEVVNALDASITTKKNKDIIVTYVQGSHTTVTYDSRDLYNAIMDGTTVYFKKGTELLSVMEADPSYITFFMFYINMNNKPQQKIVVITGNSVMLDQDDDYSFATEGFVNNAIEKANTTLDNALLKTEQSLTEDELTQVRSNLKLIGKDVAGQQFTIDGTTVTASPNAEIFGDYTSNIAVGQWSIAEGSGTVAKGRASHAEGAMTQALNDGTHTEGYQTKATGYWSHAEGEMTTVSSYASHAEGSYCTLPDGTKRYGTASGYASHVEGGGCHTTGSCAHAEGLATTASGAQSHVEGRYTIAAGGAQHVEGIANIEDAEGKYIHVAGNGTYDNRSNAHTLDWEGNGWFSGDVYVGSTSGTNRDDGSKKVATEEYVNIRVPAWTEADEGKTLKIVNGTPTWA